MKLYTAILAIFYLLLITNNSELITVHGQSPQCAGGGTSRATGLVTTPTIGTDSKFFTSAEGGCIVDPKSVFVPFKIPTYNDLKSLYFTQAASATDKVTINGNATQTDLNFTTDSVYLITGNLDLSGNPPATAVKTGVVFVEGKLNISSNYTYGLNLSDRGTVFIVKGDVNLSSSGNLYAIHASIISSGTICTASDDFNSPCPLSGLTIVSPANQLNINGSLISLDAEKPIKFRRSLGTANSTTAAEIIIHEPKYLILLRNNLSQTMQKWTEVTKSSFTLPAPHQTPLPTPTPFPQSGLVAYYKMDESSGTSVADATANNNTGTSSSSGNVSTGIIGRSRSFNGSEQISITKSTSLSSFTSFTVAGWVNPKDCVHTGSGHNTLLSQEAGILLAFNNACAVANYVQTTLPAPTAWRGPDGGSMLVPTNRWSHMAVVWDGTTVRSYFNGTLISGSGLGGSGAWTNNTNPYILGNRPLSAQSLNGNLDELGIWNRALNASEISALYNGGFGLTFGTPPSTPTFPTTGLAAYYKMDEPSGTNVADATTNNNTGTSSASNNIDIGKIGSGRSFNGSSEYVNIPAAAASSLNLSSVVTISAWVRPASVPVLDRQAIFSRGYSGAQANGSGYGMSLGVNTNARSKFNVGGMAGGNFDGTSDAISNRWYHVVGITNGATSQLWVNGILESTNTISIPGGSTSLAAQIGAVFGSTGPNPMAVFNGTIDEVGVWNRALSPAEISDLYNNGSGLTFGAAPTPPPPAEGCSTSISIGPFVTITIPGICF